MLCNTPGLADKSLKKGTHIFVTCSRDVVILCARIVFSKENTEYFRRNFIRDLKFIKDVVA